MLFSVMAFNFSLIVITYAGTQCSGVMELNVVLFCVPDFLSSCAVMSGREIHVAACHNEPFLYIPLCSIHYIHTVNYRSPDDRLLRLFLCLSITNKATINGLVFYFPWFYIWISVGGCIHTFSRS